MSNPREKFVVERALLEGIAKGLPHCLCGQLATCSVTGMYDTYEYCDKDVCRERAAKMQHGNRYGEPAPLTRASDFVHADAIRALTVLLTGGEGTAS